MLATICSWTTRSSSGFAPASSACPTGNTGQCPELAQQITEKRLTKPIDCAEASSKSLLVGDLLKGSQLFVLLQVNFVVSDT